MSFGRSTSGILSTTLPDRKPVYVISILENYSRALLASALSPTQDLVAVLFVVFDALRK